jgi:5-(carboxyamino)imidazole ribonucleotide mutase
MSENSRVAILMGSDSDWPKIKFAADALGEFNVPFEVHVMSAHRTPAIVQQFAESAMDRGIQVIIAAAGGAAHLAGVVAAHTSLPVIGIPVETEMMGGLDSLLSTVQMPGDVPVAAVGTGRGGARNAGLLAVQIMGTADQKLRDDFIEYKRRLVDKIKSKNQSLQASLSQ